MNTYWKTIILSLILLLLAPKDVQAAELKFSAECRAEWADEENGIAKITLTEYDEPLTELVNGKTDYIFMVDGSRTTTLNDKFLHRESGADTEPLESHCPCMADGHYYMIDGKKVLPVTHTLGYEYGTGNLRTWSSGRKIWADSAGAHYNGSGRKITVRYGNGCLDIFTIFKNTAIETIQKIAARKDGSQVAFFSFSGTGGELYGVLDYTADYDDAVQKIKRAEFLPGSYICPGIDRARKLYDERDTAGTTKVFIMGDGRNSDMASAQQKAQSLRAQQGVTVYSACMGLEACTKGSGYDAMYALGGRNAERFWRIRTSPSKDMAAAFAEVMAEKTPVEVTVEDRTYTGVIAGEWEYYENEEEHRIPQCSHGTFSHSGGRIIWNIPQNAGERVQCSFYVKLKEEARYVAEKKSYEVMKNLRLSGVIRGGTRDKEPIVYTPSCNPLNWKPSAPEVTKVRLVSGISSKKAEDVWYVKGGGENVLSFTSSVKYANQLWKPEVNVLYERYRGGESVSLPEKEHTRSEDLSRLRSSYTSVLHNDEEIREYYPQASAGREGDSVYTKQFDEEKKLTLICDAVPPDITGEIPEVIRGDTVLKFTATDDGSGVKAGGFVLELRNEKTGEKKIFTSLKTEISWNIRMSDPFYSGNISWTLRAEDRVTNCAEKAGVANIRPPKDKETIAGEIRTRIL